MKNSSSLKRLELRAVFLIGIAMIAAFVALIYPLFSKNAFDLLKQEKNELNLTPKQRGLLIEELVRGNYVMPVLYGKEHNADTKPSDLYFNELIKSKDSEEKSNQEAFKAKLDRLITGWESGFASSGKLSTVERYGIEYLIYDNQSKLFSTNSANNLELLTTGYVIHEREMIEKFAFYTIIHYRSDGTMDIPAWYGMDDTWKEQLLVYQLRRTFFYSSMSSLDTNLIGPTRLRASIMNIENPKNFTIVYALPRKTYADSGSLDRSKTEAFLASGVLAVWAAAAGMAVLLGIWAARMWVPKRKLNSGGIEENHGLPKHSFRLPVEFWLVGALLPVFAYKRLASWSYETMDAQQAASGYVTQFYIWAMWFCILFFWFGLARTLSETVHEGFGSSIQRRSLIVGRFALSGKHLRKGIIWLQTFDFADRTDRSLIKVMVLHLIAMTLLVLSAVHMGYYALILLFGYAGVLFFKTKKEKDRLHRDYDRLYTSVRSMAEGDLELNMKEDLNVFEPLKQELQCVRENFKKAVEEESKSQKMKSELVTNVSHDLKTPLTALSTYIDLLQQPDLTEEERKTYTDVIAAKSQRLNRLIEDLFEYTQASSGSVKVVPVSVDLVELLQQARVELEEEIEESGVQMRVSVPSHKIFLPLDSEKTFRIFGNLYLNIAKYSMSGSRAYAEVTDTEQEVTVTFKNVSETELDFDTDEITERFVRGDRSRHTEGSGLGLAIVKSLVEIQGGTFEIELDGDLFKAIIRWPKIEEKSKTA